MFAWLIKWADPSFKNEDNSLYNIANEFVKMLLSDNNYVVNTIEVGRQWQNIDLWAEINDDTFLIIEDKTNISFALVDAT